MDEPERAGRTKRHDARPGAFILETVTKDCPCPVCVILVKITSCGIIFSEESKTRETRKKEERAVSLSGIWAALYRGSGGGGGGGGRMISLGDAESVHKNQHCIGRLHRTPMRFTCASVCQVDDARLPNKSSTAIKKNNC